MIIFKRTYQVEICSEENDRVMGYMVVRARVHALGAYRQVKGRIIDKEYNAYAGKIVRID